MDRISEKRIREGNEVSTFYYRQGGRWQRRRGLRGGGCGRERERDAATRTRAARRGGGGVVGQGDGGAARCYVLTVASSTASKQGMNAKPLASTASSFIQSSYTSCYDLEKDSLFTHSITTTTNLGIYLAV